MDFLLFGTDFETLQSVFDDDILDNGIFKNYEYIIKEDVVYKDVEYAFGTWGVPSFCESEISRYFPSLKILFYDNIFF